MGPFIVSKLDDTRGSAPRECDASDDIPKPNFTLSARLSGYELTVFAPSADFMRTGFLDYERVTILPRTERLQAALEELITALNEEFRADNPEVVDGFGQDR